MAAKCSYRASGLAPARIIADIVVTAFIHNTLQTSYSFEFFADCEASVAPVAATSATT